jgi:tRNA nucleotidyltransferase (CCA-adding enzyme)
VTPELAPDLYVIGVADALGKGRDASEDIEALSRLRARVEAMIASGAALSAKDLAINGTDLMKELELKPGRIVGQVLERLVELVTDDPSANERARLLDAARSAVAELSSAG